MSLFPAFKAQPPDSDPSPADEKKDVDAFTAELEESIFSLLPPESDKAPTPKPEPRGRNRHPVDMTDLSRLSIDQDGLIYWDGLPVETHHRFVLSRGQIIGATIVSVFLFIAALGAALQGATAARDWGCRLGLPLGVCSSSGTDIRL